TASGARWRFSADIRTEVGAFGRQLLASLARELLANAARHARAREVSVAVTREDGHVLLRVSDDGEGITPGRVEAARAEGHIGLAAQRARVEALSGWFAVSGSEGGGTTVVAAIPTAVADAAGELSHAAPARDD
ncbi:MAG: two-component system, NarL family, sensor kinase, partial [Solirubrobacteraceae bacterium]|nr:two-component system, NarL family, sensor kinase [Solirubrobacteraceae bacterium]